jgi:NTE family protein
VPSVPKVAIACQGGGSHAAFAAGVLLSLLAPGTRERFELVALSGTSGGAICACLAWAGMLGRGPDEARSRLQGFWRDLEVDDPFDAVLNFWNVWFARLPVSAELSPYTYEPIAENTLRTLLQKHVDLKNLPPDAGQQRPKLFFGATDVLSGDRVIFDGKDLMKDLTYNEVVASAAVPPLYRAVKAGKHLCWDGLFSTNPPVREFTDLAERPDEIWVVQINPQRLESEPRSVRDIVDRRNELSGNLSLGQELYFIDRINRLLREHDALRARYKHITIRVVELGLTELDYPSKLDRRAELIERLIEDGESRADAFFSPNSIWPREGSVPAKAVQVGS